MFTTNNIPSRFFSPILTPDRSQNVFIVHDFPVEKGEIGVFAKKKTVRLRFENANDSSLKKVKIFIVSAFLISVNKKHKFFSKNYRRFSFFLKYSSRDSRYIHSA